MSLNQKALSVSVAPSGRRAQYIVKISQNDAPLPVVRRLSESFAFEERNNLLKVLSKFVKIIGLSEYEYPKTPEDLILEVMKLSGKSRFEVEAILNKAIAEMNMMGKHSNATKSRKGQKEYTETSYPHYLPAENVLKYTLRIALNGIKPAIWRKIEVPSNITLRHLGDLIVDLMGWGWYHLNQFCKGNDYYMPHYQRESSGEDDFTWTCNNYDRRSSP